MFNEFLRGAAETIGTQLGPEEDWAPMAFIITPESELAVIGTEGWKNDDELVAYVYRLAELIVEKKAQSFGMVATIWTLEVPADAPVPIRPRDHPDRVETLSIATYTADKTLTAHAVIGRHPDHAPTLQEWEVMDAPVEGGMATPIQAALRKVRDE